MKFRLLAACTLALALALPPLVTAAQPGDDRILAAREALRTGDRATLERLAGHSSPHVLDQYVQLWLLVNRLARPDPAPVAELEAFVARNADTVLAERLHIAWLQRLAKDGDWHGFLRVYRGLRRPDAEMRCQHWHARVMTGDLGAIEEVAAQWMGLIDSHAACEPLLRHTATSGAVDSDAVWWRFRRQIDSRSPEASRATLAWLPKGEAPPGAGLDQALSAPATYLDRLAPNFAVERAGRELALAALTRLARSDVPAAHVRFARISDRLPHEDRAYAYSVLALHGAQARLPLAADWFRAAGDTPLTPAQRAWRVRAALRIENWPMVRWAIEALPETEQRQPEWIYWLARAHAAAGDGAAAQALYGEIAGDPHFYGILAGEELGTPFAPPPSSPNPSAAERERVRGDAGLRRALALYRLDLRTEALREWVWAVRDRDSGFLVAAAELALEHGLYDRAINTAELADARANFELRFITPFRDVIEPQVRRQGLDMAWVYGIMRQESRFVVPARSSAGAQGLMQVMPATGRYVAGRIGMKGFQPRMLNDPDTNVLLGTSYMRLILEELDHHPVLASAGYNAGPGRARRWRDERTLEGAIYAETIPFDETRDYVKKVLANAVIYAALLENRPQSLKQRLGVIAPAPAR